ncbi:Xaa-Pro dipeptidase (plasmid) [Burkholderia sp. SFA1]|nr:Xaa-Pro dipeptidase [Burkholderia sp. SFA1]
MAVVIDVDSGIDVLIGDEDDAESEIWSGKQASTSELATKGGFDQQASWQAFEVLVDNAIRSGREIHFLPPYRADAAQRLSRLTRIGTRDLAGRASIDLIRAVVSLREVKSSLEIDEISKTMAVTAEAHLEAMRAARPGAYEYEGVAAMRYALGRHGLEEAYAPVFTKNGHVLHNNSYGNKLASGDLVVNDYGANSASGYATDITRTIPVGGRFLPDQIAIYDALLRVQQAAIDAVKPVETFASVHRIAATGIAREMTELGFFAGNVDDLFESGAYAICFPHGLGHQLGLDVHDMESLGEDHVGYDAERRRSTLFGLRNLRLGKRLLEGMVVTVEPGIYFIPPLIHAWKAEGRHRGLINYEKFEAYAGFGGIRIEDNVAIDRNEARVLSAMIPKTREEIESAMSA